MYNKTLGYISVMNYFIINVNLKVIITTVSITTICWYVAIRTKPSLSSLSCYRYSCCICVTYSPLQQILVISCVSSHKHSSCVCVYPFLNITKSFPYFSHLKVGLNDGVWYSVCSQSLISGRGEICEQ